MVATPFSQRTISLAHAGPIDLCCHCLERRRVSVATDKLHRYADLFSCRSHIVCYPDRCPGMIVVFAAPLSFPILFLCACLVESLTAFLWQFGQNLLGHMCQTWGSNIQDRFIWSRVPQCRGERTLVVGIADHELAGEDWWHSREYRARRLIAIIRVPRCPMGKTFQIIGIGSRGLQLC